MDLKMGSPGSAVQGATRAIELARESFLTSGCSTPDVLAASFVWDGQSHSAEPIQQLVVRMEREAAIQGGHPDDDWWGAPG